MDVSRFRSGDWLLTVAGGVMLILGLAVHWSTVHAAGRDLGGARNVFDYPFTGGLAWLLVVAAGVLAFLLASGLIQRGRTPWPSLLLAATALAALLMIVRVVLGAGADERSATGSSRSGRDLGLRIARSLAALGAPPSGPAQPLRRSDSIPAIFRRTHRRPGQQRRATGRSRHPTRCANHRRDGALSQERSRSVALWGGVRAG